MSVLPYSDFCFAPTRVPSMTFRRLVSPLPAAFVRGVGARLSPSTEDDDDDEEEEELEGVALARPSSPPPSSSLTSRSAAYSGLSPPTCSAISPILTPTRINIPSLPSPRSFLASRIRRLDSRPCSANRVMRYPTVRGKAIGRKQMTSRETGREKG